MIIHYPSAHKWVKNITDDPISELGKNNRARLRSTLKTLPGTNISHSIELVTPAFLEWFTPFYNEKISSKTNPNVYDIFANTIGKNSSFKYFSLMVKENDNPVGATIFSERKNILSIAYRVFEQNWTQHVLQSGPSLYAEYLITEHARVRGYKKLSHGQDRNPYGMNANIGLALFKLSVGCNVFLPSKEFEVHSIDSDTIKENMLIFALPEEGEKSITKGYLCVDSDSLQKFENVTKYPERILIEVILRD